MSIPTWALYVLVLAVYTFACTCCAKDETNKTKLRCAFIIGLSILFGAGTIAG